MKCEECGYCIHLSRKYIVCNLRPKQKMNIKTEQPKWCKDAHYTKDLDPGIVVDD